MLPPENVSRLFEGIGDQELAWKVGNTICMKKHGAQFSESQLSWNLCNADRWSASQFASICAGCGAVTRQADLGSSFVNLHILLSYLCSGHESVDGLEF